MGVALPSPRGQSTPNCQVLHAHILLPPPPLFRRYWYPLAYFQSLALQPTALIGLNADLKPPKFSLHCSVRPSVFAYAAPLSAEAAKEVKMVEKAVLSTTARANAKAKSKDAEKVAEGEGSPLTFRGYMQIRLL